MAISIISVSSDSSEESVRTSTGRVILFGTIPTTIPDTTLSMIPPSTHVVTTPIPIDLSPDHIPPLPATSPFLSSIDDSSDSDIPDTPPSPTHGTAFTETTLSTQRSPTASGVLRCRVMILIPGQPIPHGRPYRYHLNGPVHMITVRKRVGLLPTHRLAMRYSVDYSSSDHLSLDDSLRDSSSSSSSETSSDSSVDVLSDFASIPSIPRSSTAISARPSHDSFSASPSYKRSRSLIASVPLSSLIPEALSYARADHLPSPKRIRSSDIAMDLEVSSDDRFEPYVPRGAHLEMDVDVMISDGIEIDPKIRLEIDECIAYADAIRDRGIDARVVVEAVDQDEGEGALDLTHKTLRDLVQRFHDHTVKIQVHRVKAIEGI
nr:hypothetical protein [Tanacetum cinerariifolium]